MNTLKNNLFMTDCDGNEPDEAPEHHGISGMKHGVRRYQNRDGTLPDEALEHHGISGMKWGIRRYQNRDGTLTDAGRRRYNRRTRRFERQYRRMKRAGKEARRTKVIGSERRFLPAIVERRRAREEYNDRLDRASRTLSGILNDYGKAYVSEMSPEIIAKGNAISVRIILRKAKDEF